MCSGKEGGSNEERVGVGINQRTYSSRITVNPNADAITIPELYKGDNGQTPPFGENLTPKIKQSSTFPRKMYRKSAFWLIMNENNINTLEACTRA